LNVEKATTQPVWLRERQARSFLKSPPRSLPCLTRTLPPISSAEITRLRCEAFFSTSSASSRRRTKVPCEWPMNTTPRPLL
jgi:hypothetical protein